MNEKIEPTTAEIVKILHEEAKHIRSYIAINNADLQEVAADRLEQQEAEIAELRDKLNRRKMLMGMDKLERELAAAKADIERSCDNCKHASKKFTDEPCNQCDPENTTPDYWEWRGPQEATGYPDRTTQIECEGEEDDEEYCVVPEEY